MGERKENVRMIASSTLPSFLHSCIALAFGGVGTEDGWCLKEIQGTRKEGYKSCFEVLSEPT